MLIDGVLHGNGRAAINYRISVAYTPDLPGCVAQGKTYEEALANVREAVQLNIEPLDPSERQELNSRQISTTAIEVSIA